MTDFLVAAADFTPTFGEPRPGDQVAADGQVYEVMDLAGQGHWRWSDPHRTTLRIHAKRVGMEAEHVPQRAVREHLQGRVRGAARRKLDRLDDAVRGNGQPGIQVRLDRLESADRSRSKLLWILVGAAVTLAASSIWQKVFGG